MIASLFNLFGIVIFIAAWINYDHYRPWVNFHSESLAFLGVGLLVLSRCIGRKEARWATPKATGVIIGLMILVGAQYVFGLIFYFAEMLVLSLYFSGVFAAILLGFDSVRNKFTKATSVNNIYFALLISAVISATIGLLQWLNLQESFTIFIIQTEVGDRAMGNLGQPNQLATLLIIGLVCLVWIYEKKLIGATGLIVCASFLTVVITLTQSRAGIVSFTVVSVFLMWKHSRGAKRLQVRYIFVWLLIFLSLTLVLPYFQEALMIGDTRSRNILVDNVRVIIWKQMMSAIAQAPWLGYGWNQTPVAAAAGSIYVGGAMTYDYSHSVLVDIIAWSGIPLGLSIITFLLWWIIDRVIKAKDLDAIYGLACFMPIMIHSLVEFPFAYSYFLLTAGLAVGIVEGHHPHGRTIMLRPAAMGALIGVWFVVGVYISYEYLLIETDFQIVRFENLRIGHTPATYNRPTIHLLTNLRGMTDAARVVPTENMTSQQLTDLREASLRYPYGSLALRYALALGINGDWQGATRQMAVIRGMYGEAYYKIATDSLRSQQRDSFPQLSNVITP
jgi:O-antigen ligase